LLGINTRTSSASPEEIEDVLNHTEDWMMSNDGIGTRIGWVQNGETPDPSEESGLPDWSIMGVVNSMACYVAPYFEKAVNPQLVMNAALGMQTILTKTVETQNVQYPYGFPRGQANQQPWGIDYYYPVDRIETGNDFLTDEGDDPVTT
jgi:hypothetical protein